MSIYLQHTILRFLSEVFKDCSMMSGSFVAHLSINTHTAGYANTGLLANVPTPKWIGTVPAGMILTDRKPHEEDARYDENKPNSLFEKPACHALPLLSRLKTHHCVFILWTPPIPIHADVMKGVLETPDLSQILT